MTSAKPSSFETSGDEVGRERCNDKAVSTRLRGVAMNGTHFGAGDRRLVVGPLRGLRVIELASIGPGPHACMFLADLGAEVVRVERPSAMDDGLARLTDGTLRSRTVISADLKQPDSRNGLLSLIDCADVLIEGMRPGAAERLGVGPGECLKRNPRLVYGRMTGWGQSGALALTAGHDINYIGVSGVLHAMGARAECPAPPLNLVGDYGGGSMLLLVGVLSALLERERSGEGQIVDAAMVDGTALLSQLMLSMRNVGDWNDARESNLLDGAAPFYRTYKCADGRFVAVGALEPEFFAILVERLELDHRWLSAQYDREAWPAMRSSFELIFGSRSRDEWAELFEGTDACVTPVLSFSEAPNHKHLAERKTYVSASGTVQASPGPRFSRSQVPVGVLCRESVLANVDDVRARWARQDEIRMEDEEAT